MYAFAVGLCSNSVAGSKYFDEKWAQGTVHRKIQFEIFLLHTLNYYWHQVKNWNFVLKDRPGELVPGQVKVQEQVLGWKSFR